MSADEHQKIVGFCQCAEAMFGWTAQEILGWSLDELFVGEDLLAGWEGMLDLDVAVDPQVPRAAPRRERLARRRNMAPLPVEVSISVASVGGAPLYTLLIADISRPRDLDAELTVTRRLEAVCGLAAAVVHDLNTILASISVNAWLARQDSAGPDDEAWEAIDTAVSRGTALAQSLLAMQRLGSNPLSPRRTFDPSVVVSQLQVFLRRIVRTDVVLEFALETGAGLLRGDTSRFEQALLNLVVNANDASHVGGRIRVRLSARRVAEPLSTVFSIAPAADYIVLSVADSGQGFPLADLPRLFRPFYSTKPRNRGTGLGLAVVRDVVADFGGFLVVASTPGEGAKFDLLFPKAGDELEEVE